LSRVFSGIVEEVGRISEMRPLGGGRRIELEASAVLADLRSGDSVAVDGVCLTATDVGARSFGVDATATTLSRTTLGEMEEGRAVNLERALAAGDRLGGHLVQGHVDGVGSVVSIQEDGEQRLIDVALPEEVARATVERGSLAVDGVSLTVAEMRSPTVARVAVIPYTWTHTNFARLRPGSAVNLEADLIGRYVAKHLESMGESLRRDPRRS
jgi:riboflavin synthase